MLLHSCLTSSSYQLKRCNFNVVITSFFNCLWVAKNKWFLWSLLQVQNINVKAFHSLVLNMYWSPQSTATPRSHGYIYVWPLSLLLTQSQQAPPTHAAFTQYLILSGRFIDHYIAVLHIYYTVHQACFLIFLTVVFVLNSRMWLGERSWYISLLVKQGQNILGEVSQYWKIKTLWPHAGTPSTDCLDLHFFLSNWGLQPVSMVTSTVMKKRKRQTHRQNGETCIQTCKRCLLLHHQRICSIIRDKVVKNQAGH